MTPIDKYKDKYKYLNRSTIEIASLHDPELLKELIEDETLRPFIRGIIIDELSIGAREEYFDFIKSFIDSKDSFIAEGAYLGLYEYYDSDREKYSDLKVLFKNKSKDDMLQESVKYQIKELLYLMD